MAKQPKPRKAPKPPASGQRVLITPEGVDLGVDLAPHASRAGAFLIDLAIMFVIMMAMSWLASALLAAEFMRARGRPVGGGAEAIQIIFMLGFFLLRNSWFILWEMRPKAATPGKRMMRIRVAMRSGGRLTPDAIIARNIMRELELFLPMTALGAGVFAAVGFTGVGGAFAALAAVVWSLIFVFMPMFNRDRLRGGDLIAGTWVVEAPRPKLEPDLAADADQHAGRFRFTDAQADAYGVFELHRLEEVLRHQDAAVSTDVARRIRAKIGWAGDEPDADFLRAYYAALRKRLEHRLAFGHRRRDKHDYK